jgi:hypothetical protein
VSETSSRASAKAPTAPVASAAIRSTSRGEMRPATWLLVSAVTPTAVSFPNRKASPTTSSAPPTTSATERARFCVSPMVTESTVPRIGVMSGATIIAPITVAVESPTIPAAAMTAESASSVQKRLSLRPASGPSKNSCSRMRARSYAVTSGTSRG